jgi:hypothetical protein
MNKDLITEIGFDKHDRLYVKTRTTAFPYIYREAREINWDDVCRYLFAPSPPRSQLAEPIWWFRQIILVVKEQSCDLRIDQDLM